MTLVLSIATPKFAVQVSDRRLTWTDAMGGIRIADDEANKQTVFHNRMVFAYTGLARIAEKSTDVWLAHTLAESPSDSLSDAVQHLRDRATEAFKIINLPSVLKRLKWTRIMRQVYKQ